MNPHPPLAPERFSTVRPEVASRGSDYSIQMSDTVFKVRHYPDMPAWFVVISPAWAIKLPAARQLVDYLISEAGCRNVDFYHAATDSYQEVDCQTLAFKTFQFEPCAA